MPKEPTYRPRLLNSELIRSRRLSLFMSERTLAETLGVTGVVIHGLERGLNHAEQPLAVIIKLAETLALEISDLLTAPERPNSSSELDMDQAVKTVGALLVGDGRLVPLTAIAESCAWTLEQTSEVLAELDHRLKGVGMRVHHLQGDAGIQPALTPPGTARVLAQKVIARRGLSLRQAQVLRQVADGLAPRNNNADRVALASLINAGLVEHPAGEQRGGKPTLTEDARFSLELVDSETSNG